MKFEKEAAASAQAAHRHLRVQTSIQDEIGAILRDDTTDPDLEGVRVTALVLSPDSKLARVHFTIPKGRERGAVERALGRATSFIRGRLAESVELKRTPDLRFIFEAEVGDDPDTSPSSKRGEG